MNRVKRGQKIKNKRKMVLLKAEGFRGAPNRLYRVAKQQIVKAETNRYKHSKQKKRLMRKLWIIRFNAFLRIYNQNYSHFIGQSRINQRILNRKILSQLALYDNAALVLNLIK